MKETASGKENGVGVRLYNDFYKSDIIVSLREMDPKTTDISAYPYLQLTMDTGTLTNITQR